MLRNINKHKDVQSVRIECVEVGLGEGYNKNWLNMLHIMALLDYFLPGKTICPQQAVHTPFERHKGIPKPKPLGNFVKPPLCCGRYTAFVSSAFIIVQSDIFE